MRIWSKTMLAQGRERHLPTIGLIGQYDTGAIVVPIGEVQI
jgi:hypothetical protein